MAATDNPGTETVLSDLDKKRPNILLIVIGLLVFLLVVAVGGFLGYTKLPNKQVVEVEQKIVRLEVNDIISLTPFLVNLADVDDVRFLKAEFRLGMLEKPKVPLDPDGKEIVIIRDSILTLLSSKTAEQVITNEGKDALKEEIRVLVNERLPKNRVSEVFIVDFVVQL